MASAHIKIGPFELHEPIGKGGMGEVWRGLHPEQQVPVAIKVMTGKQARNPAYIESFRNEVRAVAALAHPGIVMVLDHGEIDANAERRSGGMFTAGSPYLAMELATHGSLREIEGPLPWDHIKYILFSLLDALAHAHAAGVIHRDIKPANVLLAAPTDPRPGLKLTDFGIAQAVDNRTESGSTESTTGTPQYMAPEQLRGQWRDYGPWTDLYALGCLAHQLICGQTPFNDDNFVALAHAHLKTPPPPLSPRVEIPEGVEQWVHRLLAKLPRWRFKHATDAAWALMAIDNRAGGKAPVTAFEVLLRGGDLSPFQIKGLTLAPWQRTEIPNDESEATLFDALPQTRVLDLHLSGDLETVSGVVEAIPRDTGELPWHRPFMPADWRRPIPPSPSMRLVGAGLGLYGMRAIPLVGRTRERDAIWDALVEVRQSGRAQVMLIHGAAGTGKSRLVEWMCQRANELGAASILRARHGATPGPADGLPRMVARHLRCQGLNRLDTLDRVGKLLSDQDATGDYERLALTELVCPMSEADEHTGEPVVRFGSPKERYALIRRLLERLGTHKPVIVWLDDIQWGGDAVGLVADVMAAQPLSPCPVLFLMTARDEALAEQLANQQALRDLMARGNARQLTLGPLDPGDRIELVRELLGLEGDLARQVEERTAGNPLFAVQLVGDWVQRGVLEIGPTGFVLKEGEAAVLPDDLHQVWRAHLERLLAGLPQDAQQALELAAVLGREVDNNEWQRVCQRAGVNLTITLLHTLFSSRLALPEENGWSFTHGMLRESLERLAREAGTLKAHHKACARMLRELPNPSPDVPERLGRHCFFAGDLQDALAPLLQAAARCRDKSDYRAANALLDMREQAMADLDLDPADPRWGQGWVLRSWVERLNWQFDEAMTWADRARQAALTHRWPAILPEALWGLAWIVRQQGDRARAADLYQQALDLYRPLNDPLGMAHCLKGLAIVTRQRQRWHEAADLYRQAHDLYRGLGDLPGVASCLYGMGAAAHSANDHEQAAILLSHALELNRQQGDQQEVANCLNVMAESARQRGDLEAAADGYRQALDIHDSIGSGAGIIPRLNLCLVLLDRDRYIEARHTLVESSPIIEQTGQRSLLAFVQLALCQCAAGLGAWADWARLMPRAQKLLTETAMVDPDVARVAHRAADLARAANHHAEAAEAYRLALSQWLDLGQNDKADECLAHLEVGA